MYFDENMLLQTVVQIVPGSNNLLYCFSVYNDHSNESM